MIEAIPLTHWLTLSTLLFFIGIYGFLTRSNLITILISVELILNAVNINLLAFNKYLFPEALEGLFFSLFVIALAAAEAAVAIAIIINLYRNVRTVHVEDIDKMKH